MAKAAGPRFNVFGPATLSVAYSAGGGDAAGGSTAQLLGSAKRTPIIEILPEWTPIYGDTTGRRVPFDELRDAEHAIIRADLTRWDVSVYQTIAGKCGSKAGVIDNVGAMVHSEGFSIALSVAFPYTDSGYRFPACVLTNPERLDDITTTAAILGVVFHAIRHPQTKILYEPI